MGKYCDTRNGEIVDAIQWFKHGGSDKVTKGTYADILPFVEEEGLPLSWSDYGLLYCSADEHYDLVTPGDWIVNVPDGGNYFVIIVL